MKRYIAIILALGFTTGSVIAGLTLLADAPPPMEMSEAYPLAVKALGTNAARYHCVTAFPILTQNYYTNHLSGEWSFNFVNTNHDHKMVWAFFDDKTADIVNPPWF